MTVPSRTPMKHHNRFSGVSAAPVGSDTTRASGASAASARRVATATTAATATAARASSGAR